MADTKISALTSLTKATIATDDVFPVVDTSTTTTKKISFTELIRPLDSQFRIAGSSDNTKLVAFEVDGLTTATTRTITVPDADLTLVGLTTTQTLTNKTLTSPQLNFGSDATGDMIYRTSGGSTARLAIGTAAMILQVSAAGIPEWAVNPAAADASTTVKGVVEIATTAEITAGTSAGATGAKLVVPADAVGTSASKIVQLDSSARLPAVDGSLLTGVVPSVTGKVNVTTTDGTVSGTGTETDFLTVSIAANTLGTNNAIVGKCYFSWTNASVTSKVLKLIYGSTTVGSVTIPSGATTGITFNGYIDFMLVGAGSTSSQEGSVVINGSEASLDLTATNGRQIYGAAHGTAAENSTGALNLKLSWTQNSGETFTMRHAVVTKAL